MEEVLLVISLLITNWSLLPGTKHLINTTDGRIPGKNIIANGTFCPKRKKKTFCCTRFLRGKHLLGDINCKCVHHLIKWGEFLRGEGGAKFDNIWNGGKWQCLWLTSVYEGLYSELILTETYLGKCNVSEGRTAFICFQCPIADTTIWLMQMNTLQKHLKFKETFWKEQTHGKTCTRKNIRKTHL